MPSNQAIKSGNVLCPVRVTSPDLQQQAGTVTIRVWTQKDRIQRALKALGICWGGALVAVLIPGLHFILVPCLLVAGPIAASFAYQSQTMILGGESICPKCLKPFKIIRSPVKWPIHDLCSECQTAVTIFKTDSASKP